VLSSRRCPLPENSSLILGIQASCGFMRYRSRGQAPGLEPKLNQLRSEGSFESKSGFVTCAQVKLLLRPSERNPALPLLQHLPVHPRYSAQLLEILERLMFPPRQNRLHHVIAYSEYPLQLIRR
jgi:hypothetical protein